MGQTMPSSHITWLVPSSGLLTAQTSFSCRPHPTSSSYQFLRLGPMSARLGAKSQGLGTCDTLAGGHVTAQVLDSSGG